ncbi:hypothetical protein SD51_11185 [Alicyclobacillus tengchongensis]|nr:hypothetical protein SD51_11185 [Alicyclobacillus tengchongensis]
MNDVRSKWNEMVIYSGPHRSKSRRFAETLLTVSGWLWVCSVLLQLVLSLCLWILGASYAKLYLFTALSYTSFLIFVRDAGIVGCASLLVFGTWVVYNKRRFGSLHRRKFPRDVTTQELADKLGIHYLEIEAWQRSSWVDWRIDKQD